MEGEVVFVFDFSAILYGMTWAQSRRLVYISGIILFLLLTVVLPLVIHYYKPPTCFDGKQNGDELSVDCGGGCNLLCNSQYVPLNVLWSRFFKVSDGVYNVLAYIENPNINAVANNLDYIFKLYDKDGILLKQRAGKTFVPANKIMAVFEPELLTGKQIPQRVEFSFTSSAVWSKQNSKETGLSLSQSVVSRVDTAPRLTATILNKSINQIKNIEAIGVVYNELGNTIAFSRTVVDVINSKETKEINFNWPEPFSDTYARTEIILKVLK